MRLWVGGVEFDHDELREVDGYADQGFLASTDYLRSFLECLRILVFWKYVIDAQSSHDLLQPLGFTQHSHHTHPRH